MRGLGSGGTDGSSTAKTDGGGGTSVSGISNIGVGGCHPDPV